MPVPVFGIRSMTSDDTTLVTAFCLTSITGDEALTSTVSLTPLGARFRATVRIAPSVT